MMAALFTLRAMSLLWMALITVLVDAQKLLPWTRASLMVSAVVLLLHADGLALAASSVPGLTVPGGRLPHGRDDGLARSGHKSLPSGS